MIRFLTCFMLALALILVVPAAAQDEDLEKALDSLRTALGDSESDELSVKILKDFLVDYPETKYTAPVLNALAYYQGEAMEDNAGALAFIEKHVASLKEKDYIKASKVVLAGLYDSPEHKEKLRALVMELNDLGGLGYRDYTGLITSAFGAEEWDLALELVSPAKEEASLESVAEEHPDAPEETVKERSESRMLDLDVYEGWARANAGQTPKAIELFESAEKRTEYDYFDTPEGMLDVYWGRTLLKNGDSKEALDKLLPMALWADSETATDAVEEIFVKNGGCAEDFEQYLYEKRLEHAKAIDPFAAVDYEGNLHHSKDLLGKVTLVAFWFPT